MKVSKGKILGVNVIGVQSVHSKKNNKDYAILHTLSADSSVRGFKVETVFLTADIVKENNIDVGCVVDINYTSNGFVKCIIFCKTV